mmetsp:Transcript_12359/g.16200  ORF Transcript_12359/g.16200 Transcript_12359/m.16200 type:complete len:298 (-) Transcript_12359:72-965(-)
MKLSLSIAAFLLSEANAFAPIPMRHSVTTTELAAQRQPIMAGNWKMNPGTEEEALALITSLTSFLGAETCPMDEDNEACTEVVVFPPHPFIRQVKEIAENAGITVGAQSIFYQDKGAYTGAVSASMVKSIGCEYILCGHSERRTLFNDNDASIKLKIQKVLASGMKPILCIGETKEEYDLNIKKEICAMQLSKDLLGVTKEQMADVVIAYEPVWAIGTGLVCNPEDANAVHAYLRTVLAGLFDEEVAQATRIQYGGSVTPDSVDELMSQPDIDGCLVGGASLDASKFGRIINFQRSN